METILLDTPFDASETDGPRIKIFLNMETSKYPYSLELKNGATNSSMEVAFSKEELFTFAGNLLKFIASVDKPSNDS